MRKECNWDTLGARQGLLGSGPGLTMTEVIIANRLTNLLLILTQCADDPAGPFWMVKVNDEVPPGILNTLH